MASFSTRGSGKVAIIGSGLVGRSWAMLFASVGNKVTLYDTNHQQLTSAVEEIHQKITDLQSDGLLRGTTPAEEQKTNIRGTDSLEEAIQGVYYIQECVPENVDLKREVFKQLDEVVGSDTEVIIASSTSCIVPSRFTADLTHSSQCIVVHPVNPPYFCRMVEIVPAPWTRGDIAMTTREIQLSIGQAPVSMSKEMPGFAANRLQYVLINEGWNMVKDGLISPQDVDTIMTEGFGMRYAFIGIFETMQLNADGIHNYMERYSKSLVAVSDTFKPPPEYDEETRNKLFDEISKSIPVDKLDETRKWRDACLAGLAKLKISLPKP